MYYQIIVKRRGKFETIVQPANSSMEAEKLSCKPGDQIIDICRVDDAKGSKEPFFKKLIKKKKL